MREHEHPELGCRSADLLGGDEALVGVRGRHLDVDDHDVGRVSPTRRISSPGSPAVATTSSPGLGQQAGETLAQQRLVVRDATRMAAPPAGR